MSAHTNGPWRKGRDDMDSYHGGDGEPFANVYAGPQTKGVPPKVVAEARGDSAAECHANARLIAAAPTLYAALATILDKRASHGGACLGDEPCRCEIAAARAALAAADGGGK